MNKLRVKNIMRYMRIWGYLIYKDAYKLNIIGIRSTQTKSNAFDDEMLVFWYDDKGNLDWRNYSISTDPGTFWLQNPMQGNMGAAILKGGQYVDAYEMIDTARFGFVTKEFMQKGQVTIIRDYNRDVILDFYNGREEICPPYGCGINIHVGTRPNQNSLQVDNWSAGCQVFGIWAEWQDFLQIAQKHIQYHGNSFSYTLLDSRAMIRTQKRYGVYAVGIASSAIAIYAIINLTKNK